MEQIVKQAKAYQEGLLTAREFLQFVTLIVGDKWAQTDEFMADTPFATELATVIELGARK